MNPGCARLNNMLAWCSPANKYSDIPVYIEIDLNKSMDISEITTQGFRAAVNAYYVMQYNVSFSNDRVTWKLYKEVNHKLNIYFKISGSTCLHNHFFRIFLPPKAQESYCTKLTFEEVHNYTAFCTKVVRKRTKCMQKSGKVIWVPSYHQISEKLKCGQKD